MNRIKLLLAALVAVPVMTGAAQTQKAGLWATTLKIDLGGATPQLDPALLAQMEAMGIELPFVKPVTRNICLTPAQVAKGTLPEISDPDSGCATKNTKRDGDVLTGDVECSGQLQGKGTMTVQLTGAESYTGSSSFSGSQEGFPVNMNTEFSGKWLAAQCGDVKPFGN